MSELQRLTEKFGGQHYHTIGNAMQFLNIHEPSWKQALRQTRDLYISRLLEAAHAAGE